MTPEMETKSDRILTSVKLWFLLPLPCEINVFTVQDPSKNYAKSLQKKTLQPDPPKILNFQPQGASGWQHEPKRLPKGFLLGGPGTPKTVPKGTQSAVENRLLKTDRVFLQMDAKMDSQSNLNWPKASQKRSLETSWMKQTRGSYKLTNTIDD